MLPEARVTLPVTKTEAEKIAREIYGFESSARQLPGEYDDNFHLRRGDGCEFVLKVMHTGRERSFIDMQCQALQHLAVRAPHVSVPRVCPTQGGEPFQKVTLPDGGERLVWLLSFLPGSVLAEVCPKGADLIESLGSMLGEMDKGLKDFSHASTQRDLKWDLAGAGWIRDYLRHIEDASKHALVEKFLSLYETEVVPALPRLRRGVIYGDANDHNVLVSAPWPQPRKVTGVIDFGDMHHSIVVAEPAIAAAYVILGEKDPLQAATALVRGYHRERALEESEIAALYPLIAMRLAVSVTNSAHRKTLIPDDPYVTVSEGPAWEALERLAMIHPRFALYSFRGACVLPAVPRGKRIQTWLHANAKKAASILDADVRTEPCRVFDLSVGSMFFGADPREAETPELTEKIFGEMRRAGVAVGVGRYDEARLLYTSPLFGESKIPIEQRRTIHLGMDLFVQPGTNLNAPLAGTVHLLADNAAALDYGPVVILRHVTGDGDEFFTLYGHLSRETLEKLRVGQTIAQGEEFARVGEPDENGGWTPHVHFQIILDLLDRGTDFPGVAPATERELWTSLSPDPNLLLGIPAERFPAKESELSETLVRRKASLGKNLSVSYRRPLRIVRGRMQYLYDDTGRAYLDTYNNVPLVGHSHPRVVRAAQEQLGVLNTNTRYLHDNVVRYAERLTRRMPEPLRICYFVNSGSEANELALRLARAHTRQEDVIVLEHAYHGHTNALIDISPYKFDGPGGRGRKPWVHVAPIADDYRGLHRRGEADIATKYARHVAEILEQVHSEGRGVAAYIAETLPSVAGQIVLPPGYLAEVYRHVRAAGGVCIADEVQVGFGRLGTNFWGFETQGVVPDIVVLGKPIGNGFPLAAVVTTREISASFANGMEFFSTFGGNPVAAAVGLAVLDVLEEERLQERAMRVGKCWMARLMKSRQRYPLIGDVRGSGLFLGVDLVRDATTREPASDEASYIVNRLRDCGILCGTDGPHHNVLKLRPPLIFSEADADLFADTFESILEEDAAQPQR
jgi:4-aminobutyrate aminotransferase-like enzyme/Ser/Thr protein kinase RdoA (MazF antagonist)